ncbi:hypothetical protein V8B55DRAFT_1552654 [Mucor lusitanicus]|uniref:Vacuolar sorting protein Vps3844 C-terminal domain-containing protein n=2 Tax=Mucor circinelloides f. lusitanicus TaxID=29924 RepID=A0A168P5U0_MUCCL|nr:hypothetical protein FB192DRAFT_1398356 [Mucor lusitanicus]OAD07213.1 hypothetical protein MUCCIDRAFT_155496 [Mucor lusitanicus CBS 277.49]
MKLLSLTTVIASVLTGVLARSSVHLVSSNNENTLGSTAPEVSMKSFSMFYSHMMDISSESPALRLQNENSVNSFKDVQELASLLPASSSLFEKKVDGSMVVIVSGAKPDMFDASFYVSDDEPDNYASLVESSADEAIKNNDDLAIVTYKDQEATIKMGANVIEKITQDEHMYEEFKMDFSDYNTDLFSMENEAASKFIIEVQVVKDASQYSNPEEIRLIEMDTLSLIGQEYGFESSEYKEAQLIVKDLFEKFVIPNFQGLHARGVSTFILTPSSSINKKKRALPVEETCFKTSDACKNGTSNCSGNGQCTKIQENCYTCACKSSSYIGEACQYVDAVGDFQLLFWTSVLLVVITASVVVCVYQSGNIVDGGIIMAQSLPKQD